MLSVQERLRLNAEADAMDSGYMSLCEYRALAWAALDRYYPERPGADLQPRTE